MTTHEKGNAAATALEEAADDVFEHPAQIEKKHHRLIGNIGRVGFATKALMYGLIGGLLIKSASEGTKDTADSNQSPQGVFTLIGSEPGTSGIIYLSLVLGGLLLYVTWRLAEGITGQGYDSTFSKKKNFFRFRLAPLISAAVYISYAIYVINLLRTPQNQRGSTTNANQSNSSCFPLCWRDTAAGTFALVLLAIAFSIATLTQLTQAFKPKFLSEMDKGKLRRTNKAVRWGFITIGRLGYLGRALLFLAVAYFFWRLVAGKDPTRNDNQPALSQALNGFTSASYAPYFLAVMGSLVLLNSLFTASQSTFVSFRRLRQVPMYRPPLHQKIQPVQHELSAAIVSG